VIAGGELLDIAPIDQLGGIEARMPVVRWWQDGRMQQEHTPEPAAVAARLYRELGEVARLEVVRPSLEDVYLGMIGAAESDDADVAVAEGVA